MGRSLRIFEELVLLVMLGDAMVLAWLFYRQALAPASASNAVGAAMALAGVGWFGALASRDLRACGQRNALWGARRLRARMVRRCHREGALAGRIGGMAARNPYGPAERLQNMAWLAGWCQAMIDRYVDEGPR